MRIDGTAGARPTRSARRRTDLGSRTALVLGAAGELGVAAATTLADLGARVIVADDDADGLEALFAGDGRFGIRPLPPRVPGDPGVTDDPRVPGGLGAIASAFTDTDVLVHCATPEPPGAARSRSIGAGSAASCLDRLRHFAPAMAARRRGSIIAISAPQPSSAYRRDHPIPTSGSSHLQVVRSLASEMRPFGVRVNAVSATGADASSAVAFLASDASAHVSGAELAMTRGWSVLQWLDEGQVLPAGALSRHPGIAPEEPEHEALDPPASSLLPFPRLLGQPRPLTKAGVHERRRA